MFVLEKQPEGMAIKSEGGEELRWTECGDNVRDWGLLVWGWGSILGSAKFSCAALNEVGQSRQL